MCVDHASLVRGATEPGETCEIAGIGPVPVPVARKLADDSILKVLVHDSTDVRAISHAGRTIPARLRTALEELFPECCIEGCHVDRHLEIDHNIPIAEGGPTALWNLTRPCHHHHAYKHAHNLRIVGEGTRRHFEPAPDPDDRAPPDPRAQRSRQVPTGAFARGSGPVGPGASAAAAADALTSAGVWAS